MKLTCGALAGILFSTGLLAQDIKVIGHIDQAVKKSIATSAMNAMSAPMKQLRFLKIKISDKAHQQISDTAKKTDVSNLVGPSQSKQLGMNNVPVLDQGSHGSCVTFANTAAIDAALNKGDYVSQLCLLQLGRYLQENGYVPSGWEGSFGPIVLNAITTFGVINKAQQMSNGCGGLTQYPMTGEESELGSPMSPVDYHQQTDADSSEAISWSSVLDTTQLFEVSMAQRQTLRQVKHLLDSGNRLTFGVLLPGIQMGVAGAVGTYHATEDTWVLTPEIMAEFESANDFAGHEMVITGYNDSAIATDSEGRTYMGLLTLRNSWGSSIGDKGDFYMSYDYFNTLAIEVQRIRNIN
jgi:C1A family cysteine protease